MRQLLWLAHSLVAEILMHGLWDPITVMIKENLSCGPFLL